MCAIPLLRVLDEKGEIFQRYCSLSKNSIDAILHFKQFKKRFGFVPRFLYFSFVFSNFIFSTAGSFSKFALRIDRKGSPNRIDRLHKSKNDLSLKWIRRRLNVEVKNRLFLSTIITLRV